MYYLLHECIDGSPVVLSKECWYSVVLPVILVTASMTRKGDLIVHSDIQIEGEQLEVFAEPFDKMHGCTIQSGQSQLL